MLFQHQPHEFHHLKTLLFTECQLESNNPLLQTAAAENLAQPVKKRSYSTAGGNGGRGGALRNSGVGEIVEVQGGHVLRSTGRKDRHSKVCTAKGPRDRRVRLSANTAIQFYDVQDRLGYDRPSKAVDWLMKKAKAAIDELEELPAWKPPGDSGMYVGENNNNAAAANNSSSGLLPPSLDSDSIADTIKSFFPLNGAISEAQFQPYPSLDLVSRRSNNIISSSNRHSQDLKLSLQSFHDPTLIGFDNHSSGGGFMLIPPPPAPQQPLLFHQRGPLQSSNTPSVRGWIGDYSSVASSSQDFHQAVSFPGIGTYNSSGYCFPARIQGDDDEEEHDGIPNKPSSASSASRH